MDAIAVTPEHGARLERIEADVWLDLHAAAPPAVRTALGLRARNIGGATAFAADGLDSLLHNRVLGLGVHEPGSDAAVEAALAHYPQGGHGFSFNLAPFARPAFLPQRLRTLGFETHLSWAIFTRDASPPVEEEVSELRVVPVPKRRGRAFGHLAAGAIGAPFSAEWFAKLVNRPGWTALWAVDGGMPVAVATMFVRGEDAWLGQAATLDSHRRRGAQTALLAARIRAAAAAGAKLLTLETVEPLADRPGTSYRNARRLGFEVAYLRPSWVSPKPFPG